MNADCAECRHCERWREPRPWGSTVAYETLSECKEGHELEPPECKDFKPRHDTRDPLDQYHEAQDVIQEGKEQADE